MFQIPNHPEKKSALIHWVNDRYKYFCLLNSNSYSDPYSELNWRLAFGDKDVLLSNEYSFEKLKSFKDSKLSPLYGLLNYDLKNEIENLSSLNTEIHTFPSLFFFEPEFTVDEKGENLQSENFNFKFESINSAPFDSNNRYKVQENISKSEYIKAVENIRHHIFEGDVYELNFCISFSVKDFKENPVKIYEKLNDFSPNPFSALLKIDHLYILCASPERYLCKRENKIISQPIKGTIRRTESEKDDKQTLLNDQKERSENVMIVDLVRNDLSRTAIPGTIKVDELFGIYTFPHLHQMISTVSSEINPQYDITEVIKNSFPMGSMTGAPKVRAMELIEKYETDKRSAFSGAIGYIDPIKNEFDFNVVIRSIFIDTRNNTLNFKVGSAITFDSVPEKEYEECMLKAKAILEIINA